MNFQNTFRIVFIIIAIVLFFHISFVDGFSVEILTFKMKNNTKFLLTKEIILKIFSLLFVVFVIFINFQVFISPLRGGLSASALINLRLENVSQLSVCWADAMLCCAAETAADDVSK